jgi:hypothetical protein
MTITAIQMEAALKVAAEKLVNSGMTETEAAQYVKTHLSEIMTWAIKLIVTSKEKGII